MGRIISREHFLKTGEAVLVRTAIPDDAQRLLVLGKAVAEEGDFVVTCPDEYTFTNDQGRDWIFQYGIDPGNLLIVAESSDRIIGELFLGSGSCRRQAHVATLHMSVSEDWRCRGVGTILLQSAIEWAASHPIIEKLGLAVFATNTRAIGLYRKLAFAEEGRRPHDVRIGPGRYVDAILMYRFVKTPADAA